MSGEEYIISKEEKLISNLNCGNHGNMNIEFDGSNVSLGS